VVVPSTESLFMTTGAAAAVKRATGEEVELAAVRLGPIEAGTAVVTPAGRLPAGYVIHAVSVGHDLRADGTRLRAAIDAALRIVDELELSRVAFAPLGTERGVFPPDEAAGVLLDALRAHAMISRHPESAILAVGPAEWEAYRGALVAAAGQA
jgi:O-acetyl-ADP-ribose deacetylase (regulator of RNase III)